jgi:hypothetical protein
MSTIVSFCSCSFAIESPDDLASSLYARFGVSSSDFWVSGATPHLTIHLRLRGGKGGFGQAMRQEGERRSRRLPPHKDACRTLSGKRIGTLKATRRIRHLREQIKEMQSQRQELKALKQGSNAAHEREAIEERQHELGREVSEAVAVGVARAATGDQKQVEVHGPIDDDFAMLYDGL